MKYYVPMSVLAFVLLLFSAAVAQEKEEAEKDWLGSREGLLIGNDAKEFLSRVGLEYELTRVVIRLKRQPKGVVFSDAYGTFETWREIDSTDETVLRIATRGLRFSRWHPPITIRGGDGGAPVGEIILESDRGKLRVFLNPGFLLDDGPGCYDYNHRFESWTLAKLVDTMLRDKFGESLNKDFFEQASGLRGLESEKASFEKHWQPMPK